jgi:6-phosphogluconolactonase
MRPALAAVTLLLPMTLMSATTPQPSQEPLTVFISSFAPEQEGGGLQAFRLNPATGEMSLTHRTSGVPHPFFLAVSPDRRFLYSIHAPTFGGEEHEQVAAYAITGPTGDLKLLNRRSSLGTASCYLEVDATGKSVLLANYSTGSVASYPVREDGSLGEAASFIQHAGSSVNPTRQQGPHAHAIIVSPDNRYAYAADLGLDQVLGYRLDPARATLTPNRQPFVRTLPGAGPRHLTFHPNGRHLYAINELGNSVTRFDYEAETGTLIERQTIPTLPEDFSGVSHCADLKITPNGHFLYGTNRGHDSLACYRIGEEGELTLIEIIPSLGGGPQNLAITPGGELLLCANLPSSNVALFRIHPETGRLTPAGTPVEVKNPSCIRLLP